jgi:hypothetical protein
MSNKRTLIVPALLSVTIALVYSGCADLFDLTGRTGSLRVLITDKPYPFKYIDTALVTITRIDVLPVSADEEEESESNMEQEGLEDESLTARSSQTGLKDHPGKGPGQQQNGEQTNQSEDGEEEEPGDVEESSSLAGECEDCTDFITIFEDPNGKSFNLLELRNGQTDLLVDTDIPAGTYKQMRLVVTSGEITLTDGRVFPPKVPSGAQSGIKLHFTFMVLSGEQTTLLLDVDLSRAFKPIPGSWINEVSDINSFHFSPSLGMRLIDLLNTGNIGGTVQDTALTLLGDVAVTLFSGDTELTGTATEEDGTYRMIGLPPGTYRVDFSATGYQDTSVPDVIVTADTETTVDVTMEAVE